MDTLSKAFYNHLYTLTTAIFIINTTPDDKYIDVSFSFSIFFKKRYDNSEGDVEDD